MAKIKAPLKSETSPNAPRQRSHGPAEFAPVKPRVSSPKEQKEQEEYAVKVSITQDPTLLEGLVATLILILFVVVAFLIMAGFTRPAHPQNQSVVYSIAGSLTSQNPGGLPEGMWTPSKIVVQQGEPVTLRIQSLGGNHYFLIPDLGIGTHEIKAGETEEITLVPKKAGTFIFGCYHRKMVGELVVIPR